MLAPSCRVCVACKQLIDPAQIRVTTQAQAAAAEPEEARPATVNVRFPWLLFFILLLVRIVAAGLIEQRWGLIKAELVLGSIEMFCSVWVLFDAKRSGVPRPFRWALGTLLLWPIVFPWYVVRRKTPSARCPFVEGIGLPLVLLVLVAIGLLIVLVRGPIK